jgi:hypothetical protein
VSDLGAWRVRVVSTKLVYTTSLGQVLPWGATWAPLEWIHVVGKWYMRWPWVRTCDGRSPGGRCYGGMVNGNPDEDILAWSSLRTY